MYNQSGSRRWTHFRSALQLAIQRSAHKWTFENFAECFPLYVEEDKNGASATFNSIADYIEAQTVNDLEKLFKEYSVQDNIDILHRVVNEAKDRKARGENGNNVWREDLDPRAAACARTVPILESEAARLRAALAEIEEENRALQAEIEESVAKTQKANAETNRLLDKLDDVYEEWKSLPTDVIEAWTVQTTESLKPEPPFTSHVNLNPPAYSSMVLKLYAFPQSTCSRRVAVVLHEKKVPFELIVVDRGNNQHKSAEHLQKQPFGQVPYIDDDGFFLFESRAIGRYIAAKYPDQGTKLIPTDPKANALFEQAASIETSNFDAPASIIFYERIVKPRFNQTPDEEAVQAHIKKLDAKLDAYEAILSKQKYLAGDVGFVILVNDFAAADY
ncbi:hypothetical protein H0H92_012792 [Tricholoma furcatifolium]|nr:hypothetical protein H0H92_012792 [Tricholoma furcatifolium]